MDTLIKGVGALLTAPKYSDLKIVCDGKVFTAHRSVVCTVSKVFARECDGAFKVKSSVCVSLPDERTIMLMLRQEAGSRVIEHNLFNVLAVDRMLQYMYRGDYELKAAPIAPTRPAACSGPDISAGPLTAHPLTKDDKGEEKTSSAKQDGPGSTAVEHPLISHIYVYAIADYYNIPPLQTLALKKFDQEKQWCKAMTMTEITNIAAVLYANSSASDTELRHHMFELTLLNSSATINNGDFIRDCASRPDLQVYAVDLMVRIVARARTVASCEAAKHDDEVSILEDQMEKLKEELDGAQARILRAEIQRDLAIADKFRAEVALGAENGLACPRDRRYLGSELVAMALGPGAETE